MVVGTRVERMRAAVQLVAAVLDDLDAHQVAACLALDLWKAADDLERRAAAIKTLVARQVAASGQWRRDGFRSPAEQLATISGTSVAAARDQLDTSERVAALPATAEALRSGSLSLPKVAAIAAAADVNPACETQLLAAATDQPLAVVREEALRAKAAVDRDAAYERIRRSRSLREYTDGEGAWNLHARGTPEAGAALRAALDPIVDEIFRQRCAEPDTEREPRDAYAFDALVELVRRAGSPTAAAGDTGTDTPRARRARPPLRTLALLRVDLEALQRGTVQGEELCELTGIGPIPVRTARELLGESILELVITKGTDVLHVTHLGRRPTVAQQVALLWEAPRCRVQGCTRMRVEIDHRTGWAVTKTTRLDDLDPLCSFHHARKTRDGWALVDGTGERDFVPPGDPRHPRHELPP